ncbi:hypothetical protein BN3590_04456 [Clostridium sp. C105KSO15]|nr:hypothetical protein BN3590_04456 [Clostridium sp. C105KSO15]
MQLSDNAIGAYIALRKIQQSKTDNFYISVNMILYNLFDNVDYKRSDREHIYDGLLELIKEKVIVVIHEVSKTEFILDAQTLVVDKSVNEDDHFVEIASKELYLIMNCKEGKNKRGVSRLSLLRYFVNLIGTIDFNKGVYTDYAGSQKNNFVGYMTQEYLCRLSGISKNTLLSFNKILEENEIIYVYHHMKNKVLDDGTRRALINHYGRYPDKEDIEKFAIQYEEEKGIAEKIVDAPSNNHKKLANCYYALCTIKGKTYDDELIKEIYNYIHKCNMEVQKEIDEVNSREILTHSDETYLEKLYEKLRDEDVFGDYDFLSDKEKFVWGENDSMENNYTVEEILDMPIMSDVHMGDDLGISNGTTVIGQYEKQIKEIKSLMSEYQKGSTVWQELYNQLQDIDSATSSMLTNLQKWNEELLRMPLDSINTYSDSLQKVITGLNGVKSELDSATSAITTAISDQIDLLEKEQKVAADAHQAEIDALQEKADLLEKTNEKLKLQMSLEQAEYNLARSLSQKVNKEIRNGKEVFVEDYDAVRKAKEDKIDAQFNIDKYNLEQQITDAKTALDDLNDSYQNQIDALEEISKKYSEIRSDAEKISEANLATSLFGEGFIEKILSGNDEEIYATLTSLYQTNAQQLEEYQKQASSTDNIQSLIEDYVASYKAGEITYEQAMTKINGLLSQMNESMSAMDNLQNIFDYLSTVNGVGADADSILKGIKDGLSVTADELVKSLEQYNKNAGMISEHTSSWEQLTDNVKSMLDVLKQVRDNLRNALDDYDSDDDGVPYDKSRGKGWGTGDVNNGPGVEKRADGIKRGAIGTASDNDRVNMLKHLSTQELKDGETPIIAHEGEVVLNPDQQGQLLDNVDTPPGSVIKERLAKLGLRKLEPDELLLTLNKKEVIFPKEPRETLMTKFGELNSFRPNINIPDYSKTLANVNMSSRSEPIVVNLQYGDLSFPNVRDVTDTFGEFAKLTDQALRQVVSKYK